MKKEGYFVKKLLICAVCLLLLSIIPIAVGNTIDSEVRIINNENEKIPLTTDHYTDCTVWVFGKCNKVEVEGNNLWKFGFYFPLKERNFIIQAKGQENESLNVLIRSNKFGSYFGYETLKIDIEVGKGMLFWAAKSLFINGTTVFARVKAKDAWITY